MAEKLDEFPEFSEKRKYPWEQWLNGEPWLLKQGEDFPGSAMNFRTQIYRAARVRHKHARVRNRGRDLVVQATEEAQ